MKPNEPDDLLKTAGEGVSARPALKQQIAAQTRRKRSRIASVLSLTAITMLVGAVALWPRPVSAEEAFNQMVIRLNQVDALRGDFHRTVNGEPSTRSRSSLAIVNGELVMRHFIGSQVEVISRITPNEIESYWPSVGYSLTPTGASDFLLGENDTPYEIVKRFFIDVLSPPQDGEWPASRNPTFTKPGPKIDGRDTIEIHFEADSDPQEEWDAIYVVDAETRLPISLTTTSRQSANEKVVDRIDFSYGADVADILSLLPGKDVRHINELEVIKRMQAKAQSRSGILDSAWVADGGVCFITTDGLPAKIEMPGGTLLGIYRGRSFNDTETGLKVQVFTWSEESLPESIRVRDTVLSRTQQTTEWPDWALAQHANPIIQFATQANVERSKYWQEQGDLPKAIHYARRALEESRKVNYYWKFEEERLEELLRLQQDPH